MITRCRNCGCEDLEVVELGPELPDLIYDRDGTAWARTWAGGGRMWWYGSDRAISWRALVQMRAGELPYGYEPGARQRLFNRFPLGPWAGAMYGDQPPLIEDVSSVTHDRV